MYTLDRERNRAALEDFTGGIPIKARKARSSRKATARRTTIDAVKESARGKGDRKERKKREVAMKRIGL